MSTRPPRADDGSAVVEFVLVSVLVLVLLLGVVQVALALHVRSLAIDAAAEGARVAARADRGTSPPPRPRSSPETGGGT